MQDIAQEQYGIVQEQLTATRSTAADVEVLKQTKITLEQALNEKSITFELAQSKVSHHVNLLHTLTNGRCPLR